MNVGQLREALSNFDDDMEVYLVDNEVDVSIDSISDDTSHVFIILGESIN